MRVLIVGGIFDKPSEYRDQHQLTPETILARGLRHHGIDVVCQGHVQTLDVDDYDVVHVHHLGMGAVAAALSDSAAALVYTHHRPFSARRPGSRLTDSGSQRPTLRDVRRVALTRLVMRCSDAVIALSEAEAEYHRRMYGASARHQRIIPNGIPEDPFARATRRIAEPPELLFVGQLVPFKQVDVLLRAFARMDDGITLRLVFHVDDLLPELQYLAEDLGLRDRVVFEGPHTPDEIAALIGRATALVLPSAREALPSVVTEAMLVGVPVVVSDVGGLHEQVGDCGYLVQPGDVQGLAHAMDAVVSERDRWSAAALAIRERARARFSVEQMIERHVHLYRDVLVPATRRSERFVKSWRRGVRVVVATSRSAAAVALRDGVEDEHLTVDEPQATPASVHQAEVPLGGVGTREARNPDHADGLHEVADGPR